MEKIIVIDGYNLIQRTGRFKAELEKSLEAARCALIGAIKSYRRVRKTFDRAIVVFDSKQKMDYPDSQSHDEGAVCVMFSQPGEQADDVIASIIRKNSKALRITVVSDDNYVINKSRSYSSDVMSCRDFMDLLYPPGGKKTHIQKEKDISDSDMAAINRHLRKVWKLD